jgi:hypothetical protein
MLTMKSATLVSRVTLCASEGAVPGDEYLFGLNSSKWWYQQPYQYVMKMSVPARLSAQQTLACMEVAKIYTILVNSVLVMARC